MVYFHQNNAFLKIYGGRAFSFLQGLISQDLRNLHAKNQPVYSLLLNNKGKYKFDFFVWPLDGDSYLLESNFKAIQDIKKLLNFYKLKTPVQIENYNDVISISSLTADDADYKPDPRCEGLYRALKPHDTQIENSFDYNLWRLKNGLAEYTDLRGDEDTPIEIGFDELNAISYDKGCFLGQEGTNKAKHKLVVKQRLLPFELLAHTVSTHTIVTENQKRAGHVRHFKQGYGLAFVKLKFLDQNLYIGSEKIKINYPFWLKEKH